MPGHQGYNPIHKMDNSTLTVNNDVGGVLPTTNSSQQLMGNTDSESLTERNRHNVPDVINNRFRSFFAHPNCIVAVLCFVNWINYVDRFTVAGVLTAIQDDFKIGDDKGGLLQTAFILSYMICAPIFGYLGDRYSRRLIMMVGVCIWSATTLIGSWMHTFEWFLTFRALVGIGEATYSTIAPTIISDLFIGDMRTRMLGAFYFTIPVGSGFGYVIGSEMAQRFKSWRYAFQFTPAFGIIAVILLYLIKEPERGQSEGSHNIHSTSYKEDLKDLIKNKTFMLSTLGFTCVAFVAGALSWWGPKFMYNGLSMQPGNQNLTQASVSFKFGLVAMFAGLVGVPLGSIIAQKLRPIDGTCDPLICAFGLIISAPLVYLSLVLPRVNEFLCFFFMFFAEVSLNLCWSLVADILLYVVIPTRRSTAEAFQILISHMFGDAGSPYLVGVFSEIIKSHLNATSNVSEMSRLELVPQLNRTIEDITQNELEFKALQYSLFSTCVVELLGGVLFLIAAAYIIKDKLRVIQIVRESEAVPTHIYADSNSSS